MKLLLAEKGLFYPWDVCHHGVTQKSKAETKPKKGGVSKSPWQTMKLQRWTEREGKGNKGNTKWTEGRG